MIDVEKAWFPSQNDLPSGNQTWQWKIHYLFDFPIKPSIYIEDFPASHVWLAEGTHDGFSTSLSIAHPDGLPLSGFDAKARIIYLGEGSVAQAAQMGQLRSCGGFQSTGQPRIIEKLWLTGISWDLMHFLGVWWRFPKLGVAPKHPSQWTMTLYWNPW